MLAPDEMDFWKLRAVVQERLCMESLQQALKEHHGDTSDGGVFRLKFRSLGMTAKVPLSKFILRK